MKAIHKLKALNLSAKIMLIITAVCFVVFGGNYVILQSSYRAYDEQLYKHTAQVFTSIVDQVEMQFSKVDTVTLAMATNEGVQDGLRTMAGEKEGSITWLNAKKRLTNDLHSYMYGVNSFSGFTICTAEGVKIGNPGNVASVDQLEQLIFAAQEAAEASAVLCHDGEVFYLRQINDQKAESTQLLGVMIARLNIQKIMSECEEIYERTNIGLDMSVIAENAVIYSPEAAEVTTLEQDGWQIRDDRFIVQCTSNRGWRFIFCSTYDAVHSSIAQTEFQSLCLSGIITVLALFCSYYIVKRSTLHLGLLMDKIDAYAKGVLPDEREMLQYQHRHDEFGRLHRHFDRMAYDYKKLNDENYERMLLEKDAQYKQLQQQIQPHFIYNTLSLISGIAYEHEDEEIADLAISLSQLLRTSMNVGSRAISLKDELKLVEDYMYIQRKRFGDRLRYQCTVPEEMLHIFLPQFTVQPIVENAIKYALEEMLEVCCVNVFGYVEGEKAVIVVEDNGPGIDPQILQKLETKEIAAKGHGIGLQNIQKRIQLLFAEKYGLQISRKDGLTQVRICVPYRQKDGE